MTDNIPSWRKRELRGIMVPCDERIAMPTETINRSFHTWLVSSDIEFAERVHGIQSHYHGFVMVVDEDGHNRRLPWNPRAQFLSGYPIQNPILGNAIFFSEGMTGDGMDFINLRDEASEWLLDPARGEAYKTWLASPEVGWFKNGYRQQFPQR